MSFLFLIDWLFNWLGVLLKLWCCYLVMKCCLGSWEFGVVVIWLRIWINILLLLFCLGFSVWNLFYRWLICFCLCFGSLCIMVLIYFWWCWGMYVCGSFFVLSCVNRGELFGCDVVFGVVVRLLILCVLLYILGVNFMLLLVGSDCGREIWMMVLMLCFICFVGLEVLV